MMRQIFLYIQIVALSLFLSACGSGDTKYSSNESDTIVVECDNFNSGVATNDCGDGGVPNYYTCLKSGDTLVSSSDTTKIEMIENANGIKKVCVQVTTPRGRAYILKGN